MTAPQGREPRPGALTGAQRRRAGERQADQDRTLVAMQQLEAALGAAALPAVIDLATAARALSTGRTRAFELVRRGDFPFQCCAPTSPTACRPSRCSGCWV
jgi:hypothetical protein